VTGKISKSIQLITPVLSPLLRESSDRKTVEQKIIYTCALVMCHGLEPVLPSGRLSCCAPVPSPRWGMVSAAGALKIPPKGSKKRSDGKKLLSMKPDELLMIGLDNFHP